METKLEIKRLLNSDEQCIDTTDDLFDGLYTSNYSPDKSSLCLDNLDEIFDKLIESILSTSIEDHDFLLSQNFNACKALKSAVYEEFAAADDVGVEWIQKMNPMLQEFKSWCNKR